MTTTLYDEIDFNPDNQPVLQKGDMGPDVRRLQIALNVHGFMLRETGRFDDATEKAVLRFQQTHGFVMDAQVGHKTLVRLMEKLPDNEVYWKAGDNGFDIKQIQRWLSNAGIKTTVDGAYGKGTTTSVKTFQQQKGLSVTGNVDKLTFIALHGLPVDSKLLTQRDLQRAADRLKSPTHHVMAVYNVESRGAGFFQDGQPAILYERHIMYRQLNERRINPTPFVSSHPNLVNTKTGGYKGGMAEHARRRNAHAIHTDAADSSASWGLFQVMAYHWKTLNYRSVQDFVHRMNTSEAEHLESFVRYIENDRRLVVALQTGDWKTFARLYNGPGYAKNQYDTKMANEARRSKALFA